MSVEVPGPGGGVQPQRQRRGALGALSLPGLGLISTEILLGIAKAHLNGPAGSVALRDGSGVAVRSVGEEVVVGLHAVGVTHDSRVTGRLLIWVLAIELQL